MLPRLPILALVSLFALVASRPVHAAQTAASLLDESGNPAGFRTLAIGDAAPDFTLPGIDGKTHRLADYAGPEVLMVLFTSNHCPTSHSIEKRLMQLRNDYRHRSFALVAINQNHPDGLSADELGYGEFGDSFAEMKPYAEQNGWDFPYLYDGDTQATARAYGCLATPHVFIFDQARRLRYAGRFDDSRYAEESTIKHHDARNAIEALLAGQPVAVELTKPHGCSTKWREKREKHVALETSWTKIPVRLDPIDAAGMQALRANPTDKYRLFNVWATWCAPCVEEFPHLVAIDRKFELRDFELITISLDAPAQEKKAQTFLEGQGAGITKRKQATIDREGRKTNHYIFRGANQDALMAELDPDWPGPIPHTVLVAPGGKILWRHNGAIDPAKARAAILDAMGTYYVPPPAKSTVAFAQTRAVPAPVATTKQPVEPALKWHEVKTWGAEGRAFGDMERKRWFDRLPAVAEGKVTDAVWGLSRDSAGMMVRFKTDAETIWASYTLSRDRIAQANMTAIGASGIDLYARDDTGKWRWVGVTRPDKKIVRQQIIAGLKPGFREYAAYLPLFNGIETLSLGVPPTAKFEPLVPRSEKPIVFYGTSITHGASASRPGMVHTAILGRRFDRPVVNLGFSGNGRMDAAVGELLVKIDAAVYVIDCLPNMSAALVRERCIPLVRQLRAARPDTPIVLVEDRRNTNAWITPARDQHHTDNHAALRESFATLQKSGVKGLHYLGGDDLLGHDAEGSTDGSHPNDLGFVRQSDRFEPVLRAVLGAR